MTRLDRLVEALSPPRRLRIADVGANPIWPPPYTDLLNAGGADVWGFEPDKPAFAELERKKGPLETYLPYAIGSGGKATLNICREGVFTSLLSPNVDTHTYLGRWKEMAEVVEQVEVETHRLDDIEELPRVDLLKIDVQGAEVAVFQGARDRLSEAVAVITEVGFLPLYEDQPMVGDQMQELGEQGFLLHKFMHITSRPVQSGVSNRLQVASHSGQMVDGDAVFIRDLRYPDKISNEQLCYLAILADCVFESLDVTLRCLDLLVGRGVVADAAAQAYLAMVPGQKGQGWIAGAQRTYGAMT